MIKAGKENCFRRYIQKGCNGFSSVSETKSKPGAGSVIDDLADLRTWHTLYNESFALPVFTKLFSNLKDTQLRVTEGNAKMKLNHKINDYDHFAYGGQ